MIAGFVALLTCQLVGEFVVKALDLRIPGPVLGMVLLLIVLRIRRPGPETGLVRAADGLLRHLQLLFIPAGVGLIEYLHLIGAQWLPIAAGILGSWLVAMVVTAGAGAVLLRLAARPARRSEPRGGGTE